MPEKKMVSSIGIVDNSSGKIYMIDCTPDFKDQLKMLSAYGSEYGQLPAGIFLTHAHIGHYFGLAQLGHEVINAGNVPVYAMPKMTNFLKKNGPWDQLVEQENIDLQKLNNNKEVVLSENLRIKPILVPHRDEYSETVGFVISSKKESLLYIPDIDKWEKWDTDIVALLKEVDYALLDGTFYQDGEISNRNMKEIPHPFVVESIKKFSDLPALEKAKIHFTHLNHTNPLIDKKSTSYKSVYLNGFNVASEGLSFYLN
ncbi:MBL fold metallo-hydrolase [Portibacter lacus]|uniref:Coenzyme PQQ synthesis protein B n=1 Tax=Portibacter lacus TaxID=1099794 RepID=A0AA37SIZ3_9BACT|nr:MBL fold metallo-hydrolase [Portibacter lacus]GLR15533.1 coenzyme PQQ synthesis protein B [Portibacter lacus]